MEEVKPACTKKQGCVSWISSWPYGWYDVGLCHSNERLPNNKLRNRFREQNQPDFFCVSNRPVAHGPEPMLTMMRGCERGGHRWTMIEGEPLGMEQRDGRSRWGDPVSRTERFPHL